MGKVFFFCFFKIFYSGNIRQDISFVFLFMALTVAFIARIWDVVAKTTMLIGSSLGLSCFICLEQNKMDPSAIRFSNWKKRT
jgi:hypothetical protein